MMFKMRENVFALLIITHLFIITSGSNKNGHKNVEDNLLKVPKDLSNLGDLKMVLERAKVKANSTGATQVSAQGRPCTCGGGACTCCSRILMNTWNQKACVNVTYDPDEFAFTATVSMNDRILYTRAVSGKNPRPVCVPVPRIPAIRACVRFYNIYFQGRNVHACVSMEGKFSDTTLFKVDQYCWFRWHGFWEYLLD